MIDGMISSIKSIEDKLARNESIELEQIAKGFPDDHPIKDQYLKAMRLVGGDFSALPSTHPLVSILKDVRNSFERDASSRDESDDSGTNKKQIKKHKRETGDRGDISRKKLKEEQDRQIRRMASKQINMQSDRVLSEVMALSTVVSSVKSELKKDPYAKAKISKLERFVVALRRGLDDCKISQTRMM